MFKRAFFTLEAEYLNSMIAQGRHMKFNEMVEDGLMALGQAQTPEGRLLCFPNSHVHKVARLVNKLAGTMHNTHCLTAMCVTISRLENVCP